MAEEEKRRLLARKKRVRAAHRGSVTRIIGQVEEAIASADTCRLKQLRQSLSDKSSVLSKLDDELIELVEEEELEETLPPPVLPRFIEVEPFRPYEADNTAYADAVNAYYEEKNYEQAIEKFGDAIENEMQQTVGSRTRHNQIIAKSLYWQAEAYVKMQDISQAILTFESLIQTCKGHYLTVAAERRAEQLKSTKAVSA